MYNTYFPQQPQYQQYPMRQDFMAQQGPPQQAAQQMGVYSVRPVASKAEVDTFQIPFDGAPYFFYNTASGDLYVKAFNSNNGTAPVATYKREAEVKAPAPEYATMDTITEMRQTINRLAEEIERLKKPGKSVKKDDE